MFVPLPQSGKLVRIAIICSNFCLNAIISQVVNPTEVSNDGRVEILLYGVWAVHVMFTFSV